MTWLRAALDASRGKMVMAILGHPFFAGGHDVARGDPEFMAVRNLLRAHGVRVVMAGDTHDLEYYEEPVTGRHGTVHRAPLGERRRRSLSELRIGAGVAGAARPRDVGATIRITAMSSRRFAIYTPWWKWPAWVWTRSFGAWPSSAEWLSAMFDYNVAPFFQSFVVVTVDPAARRITIRPWGIHGPLTWKDFDRSPSVLPAGTPLDGVVEWVVPD